MHKLYISAPLMFVIIVAVLTYKVLHGSAWYLGPLVAVADLPGRRTLRSGGTNRLMVPSVRRSTVGNRAFTVAGPRNLKPGSSGNHIRTLSSEPAVSIHSIINLEVALLLRQHLID